MIISTTQSQNKYFKNSYLRKLPMDFRNLFFVFFFKSRRTRRNKNLTHFVQLKISYGQATEGDLHAGGGGLGRPTPGTRKAGGMHPA